MDTEKGVSYFPEFMEFQPFSNISGEGLWEKRIFQEPGWGKCFVNCLVENVPLWILTKKIEMLDEISSILDYVACAQNRDEIDCAKCINNVMEKFGKQVPLLGEILDIVACGKDCNEDPYSHACQPNTFKRKCGKTTTFEQLLGHQEFCERIFVCDEFGAYIFKGNPVYCAFCGYREVLACVEVGTPNERCGCIPCDKVDTDCKKGEFLVAHDPNAKLGMEGDVALGQQIDFTIQYENEGQGTVYGVYIMDELDKNFDENTLIIENGGIYYPSIRTIFWNIGDLAPGQGGEVKFSVKVKTNAQEGEWVKNQAIVIFPSVPEATPANLLAAEIKSIVAFPQDLQMNEGELLPITLTGYDPQNLPLNYTITLTPSNGNLAGTPPNLTYTPNENFEGMEEFYFTVDNGIFTSKPARVSITVLSNTSDTIPPEVISVSPANGNTTNVYPNEYSNGYYLPFN